METNFFATTYIIYRRFGIKNRQVKNAIFQETQKTVYFFNPCSFLAEFMYNGVTLHSRHDGIHKTPIFV